MNQRTRTVLQVEWLEDRCTPSGFSGIHGALSRIQTHISTAQAAGHCTWWDPRCLSQTQGHSSTAPSKICAALHKAHAAVVSHHAAPVVIATIEALQSRFGC